MRCRRELRSRLRSQNCCDCGSFVCVYITCPKYAACPKQSFYLADFYLADLSLGDHRRTESRVRPSPHCAANSFCAGTTWPDLN